MTMPRQLTTRAKLVLFALAFSLPVALGQERVFYVCEAGEEAFKGKYTEDPERKLSGSPTFTNANMKSIFRHGAFWYMGDLDESTWPPVSSYRCVLECPMNELLPPVTKDQSYSFTPTQHGSQPVPVISDQPCKSATEEL